MIFYGDYTCEEHAQRRYELYHRRRHRSLHTYIIYQTAKDTSQRINIFPEYQRLLINQYIPHHTAKRAGYSSHHDRHPHGKPEIQGLGDTYHHKQPQSDSIEYKKCIVQTDDIQRAGWNLYRCMLSGFITIFMLDQAYHAGALQPEDC